ncbi:hypothetical protein BGX29_004869 [Mortierella sp. GBA35]|nr:hypothetical protein BGX29_004869 [Mortierella sp. GBA35]
MSSSSSPQGNPPSYPAKFRSISSSTGNISAALHAVEYSNSGLSGSYPSNAGMPLPVAFPFLAQVQENLNVEHVLHALREQRLSEYKQAVYIAPLAKPSLQASNDKLFPLMDKVKESLAGGHQVMLTLDDSEAGKSTFNRHLEYELWQNYETGAEAVIVHFSKDQIENYVERYVPLELRTWKKMDYMDKLKTMPNLMDLVKNPHWLGVNKGRLQNQKLGGNDERAFNELLDDGFEQNGIKFQKDLTAAIFQEQEGRPVYFYSCTICGPPSSDEEFAPQAHLDSPATFPPVDVHPLSKRSLITEPSIVQFLVERVHSNSDFKQHLLALVELSKTNGQASQAAANTITILVKAVVRFNGSDLRGIRIPNADLSGGQFNSAQLQGADLTGINFTKSWILQVNMSGARMEGVRFWQLAYLEENSSAHCGVYSPDGRIFAAGLDNGDINI